LLAYFVGVDVNLFQAEAGVEEDVEFSDEDEEEEDNGKK
jgi:hypothetical protein